MKKSNNIVMLWVIFIVALAFRLLGIAHGFPFIFHPDEPAVIRTALGLRFFPNPGHFDWPHLYMYVNYFMYMGFAYVRNAFELLGFKDFLVSVLPILWNDDLIFYLLSRVLSAFIGALTIVPVYLSGKRLFGNSVGILAAIVFAVIPFHVQQSHYALVDVPMVFFVAWTMYFCIGILKHDSTPDYTGAGLNLGFATATKYNGGFGFVAILLAHFMRVLSAKEKIYDVKELSKLGLAGIIALIGFIIGTPYAILDYGTFLRSDGPKGALWQFKHVGQLSSFVDRIPNFFNIIFTKLFVDLGYSFLIIVIFVFVILVLRLILKKKSEEDRYVWWFELFILAFLLYFSGMVQIRSHYLMVCYPFVAVIVGWFLYQADTFFKKRYEPLGFIVIVIVLFIPTIIAFNHSLAFYRNDTRLELYSWLKSTSASKASYVYFSNEFEPVLEKFEIIKYKNFPAIHDVQNGYVIVGSNQFGVVENLEFLKNKNMLKLAKHFDSKGKLGPDISIYTYKK